MPEICAGEIESAITDSSAPSNRGEQGVIHKMKNALRLCALILMATAFPISSAATAMDRVDTPAQGSAVAADGTVNAVYMAAWPELFQDKPVRLHCDRLRNPDARAITCRANGVSIVVATQSMSRDGLRKAFEKCQGMMSTCRGSVSGIVRFVQGVPYVEQADVDVLAD